MTIIRATIAKIATIFDELGKTFPSLHSPPSA